MKRLAWLVAMCLAMGICFADDTTQPDDSQPDDPSQMTDQQRLEWAYQRMLARQAAATQATAQASNAAMPVNPVDAEGRHDASVKDAKEKYETIVNSARSDYLTSVLAADDQYISDLNDELAAAMKAQDLATAEKLDKQKAAAITARQLHSDILDHVASATVVRAVWVSPSPIGTLPQQAARVDVTDKLKEAVADEQRYTPVESLFINDGGGLYLTLSQDGQEQNLWVRTGQTLPSELFPPVDSVDDPASIPTEIRPYVPPISKQPIYRVISPDRNDYRTR
jgi:hypothetical protein